MKNLKKIVACLAVASMMVGCSSNSSSSTSTETEEATTKYAKVGLGVVSSSAEEYGAMTNTTTVAAVGLDADGKIAYLDLDVAQQANAEDADTRTKTEKQEDYGMKSTSGIGKEWYEQAEFLENYVVENGLTKDEVLKLTNDEGSDLASGCTISIDAFTEAIGKACDNAKDCACDTIGLGITTTVEVDSQTDTTIAVLGLDSDSKVVVATVDVAQIPFGGDDMRTKLEKEDDYGMVKASSIGKEWFEQAAAFDDALVGMTASDVANIETYEKDEEHNAVPAEGTDLASGCTINIGAFQDAAALAFENAR